MPDGNPPTNPGAEQEPGPEFADRGSPEAFELDEPIERPKHLPKRLTEGYDDPGPAQRPRETKDRLRDAREAGSSAFASDEEVDQTWSRKDEWGPSLVALIGWTVFLLFFLYLLLGAEYFTVAFVVLILGTVVWLYLCYPILITLEIPVRLTAESAVKDYYGAISHHMPHYKRMWLLLAKEAKLTPYFGSYEGFKVYWKLRLKGLKQQGEASSFTPLLFKVESFRTVESIGKTRMSVRFVVKVFVRGSRADGPISTVPMDLDLVRGPDKMWYLCNGTLPQESSNT